MASIACSIDTEFSSSSASAAPWSRPSSPSPPPPPLEMFSAERPRTPFLRPIKTFGWVLKSSMERTQVGVGGGGGCTCCCSKPQNSCIRAQMGLQFISRSSVRHQQFANLVKFSGKNLDLVASPLVLSPIARERVSIRWNRPLSATDSSEITSEDSPPSSMNNRDVTSEQINVDSLDTAKAVSDTQLPSSGVQPTMKKADKTTPETQEGSTKRTPLTAREKLRAGCVLSKYTESSLPGPNQKWVGEFWMQ